MVSGAVLVRLEMRCRSRVMAGWCWVSAAVVIVEDPGADIFLVVFYFLLPFFSFCGLWNEDVVVLFGGITDQ